jgi:hypothetical protein
MEWTGDYYFHKYDPAAWSEDMSKIKRVNSEQIGFIIQTE